MKRRGPLSASARFVVVVSLARCAATVEVPDAGIAIDARVGAAVSPPACVVCEQAEWTSDESDACSTGGSLRGGMLTTCHHAGDCPAGRVCWAWLGITYAGGDHGFCRRPTCAPVVCDVTSRVRPADGDPCDPAREQGTTCGGDCVRFECRDHFEPEPMCICGSDAVWRCQPPQGCYSPQPRSDWGTREGMRCRPFPGTSVPRPG